MTIIATADGTRIFVKDRRAKDARPVIFSHGWPPPADAWDSAMLFRPQHGNDRVVVYGRSAPSGYAPIGRW